MKSKNTLYIAYGSNINLAQMEKRCPGAKVYGKGIIADYQLEFDRVATIKKANGAKAPALVWEISSEHEKSLDVFEGYPYKYGKKMIEVSINNEKIKAMAYVMNNASQLTPPKDDYYERIFEGYTTNGLNTDYLEDAYDRSLEAVEQRAMSYRENDKQYTFLTNSDKNKMKLEAFKAGVEYCNFVGMNSSLVFKLSDEEVLKILNQGMMAIKAQKKTLMQTSHNDKKKGKLYIAYGSNINLSQMMMRCPNSYAVGTEMLDDYELAFNGCATIHKAKGKKTPVLLWHISDEDWKTLDRYEGYPSYYRTEKVPIKFHGQTQMATVYIMNGDNSLMPPSKSYYKGICEGYAQVGLPMRYLEKALENSQVAYIAQRNNLRINQPTKGRCIK